MIRIFNIYYPTRLLVLILGEGFVIYASFLAAAILRLGPDTFLVLNYEYGFQKILAIAFLALLCLHYFDLYDLQRIAPRGETWFRLLVVLGILSFILAGLEYFFPKFMLGNETFIFGVFILTGALLAWRSTYLWLIRRPFLRERVYVMGSGQRAAWLVDMVHSKPDLGMDVVGWTGDSKTVSETREELGARMVSQVGEHDVSRVIVALGDRRGTMPVRELLDVRLSGIKVEDATGIIEKISGKMDVDSISPSWLIFSEGFEIKQTFRYLRRLISFAVSVVSLIIISPLVPVIAILIKLSSPGPVLYRQKRVGRNGVPFYCLKFRTMQVDAETVGGAQWAGSDDPRITSVGRWLRRIRLDEIPQLWNVLRGDMGFVGPRPERPEFVEWLTRGIPYYNLRHIVRPGITGWAQIRYQYGASLEEAKEKLRYDLYYIKHLSVSFDVMIIMETLKIILLGRGAR